MSRAGQSTFRELVKRILIRNTGSLFCQVCPHKLDGYDSDGFQIPLIAHHTDGYVNSGHNGGGVMVCDKAHEQLHLPGWRNMTEAALDLYSQHKSKPNKDRYTINIECRYKKS